MRLNQKNYSCFSFLITFVCAEIGLLSERILKKYLQLQKKLASVVFKISLQKSSSSLPHQSSTLKTHLLMLVYCSVSPQRQKNSTCMHKPKCNLIEIYTTKSDHFLLPIFPSQIKLIQVIPQIYFI